MNHTNIEKDIKKDIINKNTLLRKIRRMDRRVAQWREEARVCKNRRQKKKYLTTVARLADESSQLKPLVLAMVEDLDARIHEEMDFSVDEVKDFKDHLRQEREEMKKIEGELEVAEEKLRADGEKHAEDVKAGRKEAETGKIEEQVAADKAEEVKLKRWKEKELKQIGHLEKELVSEESDRKIFKEELKHIETEKEILKEVPSGKEG
ncbi:MAG: hypothetical protein RAO92_06010 [Candidatus Euphemobacter frigidus]|nr:hypothetical protein [Candidatus Euphemobacter frigidus]MDP8275939.1 hypothetical protein [Candidatus Euphemobacter frigidus]